VDVPCPFSAGVTENGVRLATSPFLTTGLTVAESKIFPVKLLRLVRVIVDFPEVSSLMVSDVGLAEMLKSPTDSGDNVTGTSQA
jgi:hypothetical protein